MTHAVARISRQVQKREVELARALLGPRGLTAADRKAMQQALDAGIAFIRGARRFITDDDDGVRCARIDE